MAKTNQLVHLDMNQNQLLKAVLENSAAAPSAPATGQVYYDTDDDEVLFYDGTSWVRWADADYVDTLATSISTNTTNIGTNATNISGNTSAISSLDSAKQDESDRITTVRATGVATDTKYPSELAVRTALDNIGTAIAAGVNIKGGLDASANPNYPAAVTGDMYRITVAGKIGGAAGPTVEVGDSIICFADAAAGDDATVGSSWLIDQGNVDAATDTVAGIIRLATAAEITAGAGTSVPTVTQVETMVNDGGSAQRVAIKMVSGSTSYTINHALNSTVTVQVFNKVTGAYVVTDVTRTDANNVTVAVNVALTQDHVAVCVAAGTEPA